MAYGSDGAEEKPSCLVSDIKRALKSAFIRAHKSFSTLQRLAFWSEADLSANLCGGDPEDGGRQGAPKNMYNRAP